MADFATRATTVRRFAGADGGRPFAPRVSRARHPANRRDLRRRSVPGQCRGRCLGRRAARDHHGGAAGCQRAREPRPRAERHPELRFRVSAASCDRQPLPGRHPQGGLGVRPPDRPWGAGRDRSHSSPSDGRRRRPGRAVAGRRDPAGAGCTPDLGESASRWRGLCHPPPRQR